MRPVPASWARAGWVAALAAWAVQMAVLVDRSYLQASSLNLAADLARYSGAAQWRGVYYRGDKIGFTVGETVPLADGFELREDGRLQMALLGATTAARVRTMVRVDREFTLRSFEFSLDPGTGAVEVSGAVEGQRLDLTIATPSGRRTESRQLTETPALSLSVPRRLAAAGLRPGAHHELSLFDPATLRNAPLVVDVMGREVVSAAGRPVPAFKVRAQFGGITSFSWVTDTGEVVKEESPLGLVVVRETQDRAVELGVSGDVRSDMLEAAAVVPSPVVRIDDPGAVERLRLRLLDAEGLDPADLDGAGQTVTGDAFEIRDQQDAPMGPPDPQAARFLGPEPFIESDAPEIVAEARAATAGAAGPRQRAERLVRHVNELLEKKPTVSLPSALEVLRTRVGDCNEHTVLFVALARASGLPARIAVGLVYQRGGFYYHAWPEVYVEERGRALWLPADPTLNQFPADATHLRLARGGLDRQAVVMPLIGRVKMTEVRVHLRPGSVPVIVGGPRPGTPTLAGPGFPAAPVRRDCWSDSWVGP
ncbi:MAG: transglutaminase domain-containing protein [Vicinamibacteria bacterium]